jgi:hypothetical protein
MRLLFLINSLIGASVLSLVLSYLVQVYSGLRERNALALAVDLMTDGTGDAAVMLARLIPGGDAANATSELGNLVRSLAATKEAHHFYPLLFYFRFSDPYHSVSRSALVALDTVSLIRSALDDERHRWLKEAGGVAQLWEASMMLVTTLEETFLAKGAPKREARPDSQTRDSWRARYHAAVVQLRRAGIDVAADGEAGADTYIACRVQWDHHITNLAPSMAYTMEDIDVALRRVG